MDDTTKNLPGVFGPADSSNLSDTMLLNANPCARREPSHGEASRPGAIESGGKERGRPVRVNLSAWRTKLRTSCPRSEPPELTATFNHPSHDPSVGCHPLSSLLFSVFPSVLITSRKAPPAEWPNAVVR